MCICVPAWYIHDSYSVLLRKYHHRKLCMYTGCGNANCVYDHMMCVKRHSNKNLHVLIIYIYKLKCGAIQTVKLSAVW